ncbi:MAG TPA: DUF3787 domain-containing protein [Clostridiales bacterium]|jgi:hypothetical protein|nr:DUF3787 domain-containing protein [Clostridiales bacterium]
MLSKKEPKKPIENHRTAAWSNREKMSRIAKTSRPNLDQTMNAKEYVDENQK